MPHIDESRIIGLNGSSHTCARYTNHRLGQGRNAFIRGRRAKKILELAYNIKPEKFSHLLVPSEELVEEPVDTHDEGVDDKDPVQRAATVEVYPPIEFKVLPSC